MCDHLSMRKNLELPDEKLHEILQVFDTIDSDGNGFIEEYELQYALEVAGYRMAHFEVRDLIRENDMLNHDGRIDFAEFKKLYTKLASQDFGFKVLQTVKKRTDVQDYGTRYSHANVDTKHSIRREEQAAFGDWMERNLSTDPKCQRYFPLQNDGGDIYNKCSDGVLLCKIINRSAPKTIDERTISFGEKLSVFEKHSNITLALNSARSIGCNVVNIGPQDIESEVQHLLLGLLWQIIKVALLSNITVTEEPRLAVLAREDDTKLVELQSMSPEQLLLQWANYHLEHSECQRRMNNFTSDVKDSEIYAYLLDQLTPAAKKCQCHSVKEILAVDSLRRRAELVLENADVLDARVFVTPDDIVSENHKLNLAFVANLFKNHSGLDGVDSQLPEEAICVAETREERTYRNWMNSLGVEPYVNYLYSDLRSGIIIFQLFDQIKPGLVNWKKVIQKFRPLKIKFEQLENCNYAVQLGNESRFSLVGIGGQDIRDGNRTLTLALVWQLMRAYTLAVLTRLSPDGKPIAERDILSWANDKLAGTGMQVSSFQDPSLADGRLILRLIECLKPGTITASLVQDGCTSANHLSNASYAISSARKIGANVYALPEDITERKHKLIMTIFACLMALDRAGR